MKIRLIYQFCILFILGGCFSKSNPPVELKSHEISKIIGEMTDIMVHDITNPPLAARFYSYACLAAYEVVALNDSSINSMHGVLNEFPEIINPEHPGAYSYQVAALFAMIETAKRIQPSGDLLTEYESSLTGSLQKKGLSDEIIEGSKLYATDIANQVLVYAKGDHYNEISNYARYSPVDEEGSWYPTPPGFFAPVEPYFNTVRPFLLASADQFKPVTPVAFSSNKESSFFNMLNQCYVASLEISDDQRHVAAFWDCNPFALSENGHLMVGLKKISPGAHWMGITGIACDKENLGFSQALKIHTVVALGLMDAFIACWDEKFRSNRIRPESAIRKYIDPTWKPLLQTPPFPEYLSGHSTISASSAVILTRYFGEDYHYTDSVEVKYGLPARSFGSFHEAAIEAGISRFYGGIHFMDAIDEGRKQGLLVGEHVLKQMEGKKNPSLSVSNSVVEY